jgi:hypothetical protein
MAVHRENGRNLAAVTHRLTGCHDGARNANQQYWRGCAA